MVDIRAEAAEAKKIRELYDSYELYKALLQIVATWDTNYDEEPSNIATHGLLLKAIDKARGLLDRAAP